MSRKKRSPSATKSVIKLARKSSERLAFGKNEHRLNYNPRHYALLGRFQKSYIFALS
jgi:hypothetical protein